jgi:hypothetical protein
MIPLERSGPIDVGGTEDKSLLPGIKGLVVRETGRGGFEVLSLPTRSAVSFSVARPWTIHALAGPSATGLTLLVENDMMAKRHRLVAVDTTGRREELFSRPGDALWGDNLRNREYVSDYLAVSRSGLVALGVDLTERQLYDPQMFVSEGDLEVWDPKKRSSRRYPVRALDLGASWFPDNRQLAYVALAPRSSLKIVPGFANSFRAEEVPAVHVLDTVTGATRILHIGMRPVVSSSGKHVLVADNSGHTLRFDFATLASTPVRFEGMYSPVALVGDDLVVYRGLPTRGTATGRTENNSPLVGPKPLLALKVGSIAKKTFATIATGIDPRWSVDFQPKTP